MIPQVEAATDLYHCLLEMGEINTNPVLEVIGKPGEIMQGKKYPADYLKFNNQNIRAYYHCHAEPYLRDNEHGHFHIFISDNTHAKNTEWFHLSALSMDSMGQPLKWIMMNNWVTGGPWLNESTFEQFWQKLHKNQAGSYNLAEKWLLNMVVLYQDVLFQLMNSRDITISKHTKNCDIRVFLQDRNQYDLGEIPIDLKQKLSEILSN